MTLTFAAKGGKRGALDIQCKVAESLRIGYVGHICESEQHLCLLLIEHERETAGPKIWPKIPGILAPPVNVQY